MTSCPGSVPAGAVRQRVTGAQRATARTDAAGTTSFGYNAAVQVTSATDPLTGATVGYDSDTAGRLTTERYGTGGGTRSYGYDNLGRLRDDTIKNPSGTTVASIGYGYDLNSRMTSKATTGTAGAATNQYGYGRAAHLLEQRHHRHRVHLGRGRQPDLRRRCDLELRRAQRPVAASVTGTAPLPTPASSSSRWSRADAVRTGSGRCWTTATSLSSLTVIRLACSLCAGSASTPSPAGCSAIHIRALSASWAPNTGSRSSRHGTSRSSTSTTRTVQILARNSRTAVAKPSGSACWTKWSVSRER